MISIYQISIYTHSKSICLLVYNHSYIPLQLSHLFVHASFYWMVLLCYHLIIILPSSSYHLIIISLSSYYHPYHLVIILSSSDHVIFWLSYYLGITNDAIFSSSCYHLSIIFQSSIILLSSCYHLAIMFLWSCYVSSWHFIILSSSLYHLTIILLSYHHVVIVLLSSCYRLIMLSFKCITIIAFSFHRVFSCK